MSTQLDFSQRRAAGKRLAAPLSPSKVANLKRPRSPESTSLGQAAHQLKRLKPGIPQTASSSSSSRVSSASKSTALLKDKLLLAAKEKAFKATKSRVSEKQPQKNTDRNERVEQNKEWVTKYRAAFPKFTFYFDEPNLGGCNISRLKQSVEALHGHVISGFLDMDHISHFITNCPVEPPTPRGPLEKENGHRSPLKMRQFANRQLLDQALSFGKKVWSGKKLEDMLRTLHKPMGHDQHTPRPMPATPSLETLLKGEQIHGTSERDPSQKRHTYTYFPKGSFWVLVEDMRDELAPIIVHDYGSTKDPEGHESKPAWPKLYADHRARSPFQPFDEKEKKRFEKTVQNAGKVKEAKEALRDKFIRAARRHALQEAQGVDLRRTVSLNNMSRRALEEEQVAELDDESNNASGYVASGGNYVAASGNSVCLTSTTGSTSTSLGTKFGALALPAALRGRKEITTSYKVQPLAATTPNVEMGPPDFIPQKSKSALRKSRSTMTMKLEKRDEGTKPGYCENCRIKFKDFDEHIQSSKHRHFAENSDNWVKLDLVLKRVARRTKREVEDEERKRQIERAHMLDPEYRPHPQPAAEDPFPEDLDDFGIFLRS